MHQWPRSLPQAMYILSEESPTEISWKFRGVHQENTLGQCFPLYLDTTDVVMHRNDHVDRRYHNADFTVAMAVLKIICNIYRYYATVINSLWSSDGIWWHRSGSTLVQVMAWFVMAPSHCLNQCWLLISGDQWHSPDSNFTASAQATILHNDWLDWICLMTTHVLQDISAVLFYTMSLKIILLELPPYLLGANELIKPCLEVSNLLVRVFIIIIITKTAAISTVGYGIFHKN